MLLRQIISALCLFGLLICASTSRADIFRLTTGGELRGELLNQDEEPRKTYVIRTYLGVDIMLAANQVAEVESQRDREVQYEKLKLAVPDTIEGHTKLADWCKDNYLAAERAAHLHQVLELDRDHTETRRLLGYVHKDGRWITRDAMMEAQGFVKYTVNGRSRWVLPQEVELIEEREKSEVARRAWFRKVNRWSDQLNTRRDREARESLQEIDDVAAVPALIEALEDAKTERDKELIAEALIKLNTDDSVGAVVEASINEQSEDVRFACLDLVEKYKPALAVALYIKGLNTKYDNRLINRAALGLERLESPAATGALIDVLVTKHRRPIGGGGGGAGSVGGSFGRTADGGIGPSGLSLGEGPKTVTEHLRNQSVLDALVAITGEDFHYDIDAWKFWHARNNRAPQVIPGRRDDR